MLMARVKVLSTGPNCASDFSKISPQYGKVPVSGKMLLLQHQKMDKVQKPHKHRNDYKHHTPIPQQHHFYNLKSPNFMHERC